MAWPENMQTVTITMGSALDFFGDSKPAKVLAEPLLKTQSGRIIWAATGQPIVLGDKEFSGLQDQEISFEIPNPDQPGFVDSAGNSIRGWAYRMTITVNNKRWTQTVQPIAGQMTIDLDLVTDEIPAEVEHGTVPAVTSVNGKTGAVIISTGGTGGIVAWDDVQMKPDEFPPALHSHTVDDVTDLQSELDGKQPAGSYVVNDDPRLTDARTPLPHSHTWGNIEGKPNTFPATVHEHTIDQVTDLSATIAGINQAIADIEVGSGTQGPPGADGADGLSAYQLAQQEGFTGTLSEYLLSLHGVDGKDGVDGQDGAPGTPGADGKDGADGAPGTTTWAGITDKPAVFAPAPHTHAVSDVNGLQSALDGKQAAGDYVDDTDPRLSDNRNPLPHVHTIANVTGLQPALDSKQATGDYATNAALTSGLSGKANTSHTHTIADVDGLQAELDSKSTLQIGTTAGTAKSGDYTPAWGEVTGKPTTYTPTTGTTAGTAAAGNDPRLSDARTPTAHTHPATAISDSTTVGRSVVTATDAAAARAAIGAGTSSLALGTTNGTAKAGDYKPSYADLPAGSTLTVYYNTSWPARPTPRTDITVQWIGGTDATPPTGGVSNVDVWIKAAI